MTDFLDVIGATLASLGLLVVVLVLVTGFAHGGDQR